MAGLRCTKKNTLYMQMGLESIWKQDIKGQRYYKLSCNSSINLKT